MCGFGIVMLFNVRDIIWPNNKKIIKGTLFLASRNQFLPVGPLTVFHGHQLPLRILREVKRGTNRKRNFWRKQKGAALRLRYVHF
jgi:hypothetical protein